MMRRLLGGVLVVLLVSGVAGAQTVSTDTPKIAALRVKANAGDADAQYNLGRIYDNGQGVPQDYGQAAAWYRKAAEQGTAPAQRDLGLLYYQGAGVAKSVPDAYYWLALAAQQGLTDARQSA